MSQENKKTITINSSIVVKPSADLKKVAHKATAGLSEAEAIERNIVDSFGEDGEEEKAQSEL